MPELLLTYRGVVYPHQCDHMGHMNVMWYVSKFDEATWQFLAGLGLSTAYFRTEKRGMAAIEQHIWYKRELHAGAAVSIHSQMLEVKEKTLRFRHEMQNDETGEVAAVTELTGVQIDTVLRKACPLPPEIRERATGLISLPAAPPAP